MSSDRDMTAEVVAALEAGNMVAAVLVELNLTNPVRVWSGLGILPWDGKDFLGVGNFGGVSDLEESEELRATGYQLSLSGIPTEMISLVLSEDMQGQLASIWVAFLDQQHKLILDPVGPWQGRIDAPAIELGETSTVTITVESRMIDWERPRVERYTPADQKEKYPGDLGLDFIESMVDAEIKW